MVTILEAWLLSIFCKSPRKVLRSITSLKMWSSGAHRLITERPWNSTPVQKSHLRHSLNLLSIQDILLLKHVCICICMCVYVFVCVCMYLYVRVCIYVAALMISVKVYKGSPCGWPEVEGLSLFCICPSNCSYRNVFLFCAVCVHTGLRAVIGMYGIYVFPCNCISSNFRLVFVFQPVSACGWPEVWGLVPEAKQDWDVSCSLLGLAQL